MVGLPRSGSENEKNFKKKFFLKIFFLPATRITVTNPDWAVVFIRVEGLLHCRIILQHLVDVTLPHGLNIAVEVFPEVGHPSSVVLPHSFGSLPVWHDGVVIGKLLVVSVPNTP